MVQFKTVCPVFVCVCVLGLLSDTGSYVTLEAEVGDKVTVWCKHDLISTSLIFWLKHTHDSVPLIVGCKQYFIKSPSVTCYFYTESNRTEMCVNGQNSTLTIAAVNISDTGLYYCSYSDRMIFKYATYLHVKGKLLQSSNGTGSLPKNSDRDEVPVSPAVFIIPTVFLLCVLIIIILKNRNTHTGAETEDNEISKNKPKRSSDEVEYSCVLYSPVNHTLVTDY